MEKSPNSNNNTPNEAYQKWENMSLPDNIFDNPDPKPNSNTPLPALETSFTEETSEKPPRGKYEIEDQSITFTPEQYANFANTYTNELSNMLEQPQNSDPKDQTLLKQQIDIASKLSNIPDARKVQETIYDLQTFYNDLAKQESQHDTDLAQTFHDNATIGIEKLTTRLNNYIVDDEYQPQQTTSIPEHTAKLKDDIF